MGQTITGSDFVSPFQFENPNKTSNQSGGKEEGSTEYIALRGFWEKKTGNRNLETGVDLLISVYDAYCYWRSQLEAFITTDTRLVYDGKEYRIESYERMGERRQYMHFTVSEGH